MKLTTPILKSLCNELAHGNPMWALIVLNEYLSPNDPLHRACVQRAKSRLSQATQSSELAMRLFAGATYQQLPVELQRDVGPRASNKKPAAPFFTTRTQSQRASRAAMGRRNREIETRRTRPGRMAPQRRANSRPAALALGVAPVSVRRSL
jgi:hypothetical protein